jgi:hypothetical protein
MLSWIPSSMLDPAIHGIFAIAAFHLYMKMLFIYSLHVLYLDSRPEGYVCPCRPSETRLDRTIYEIVSIPLAHMLFLYYYLFCIPQALPLPDGSYC